MTASRLNVFHPRLLQERIRSFTFPANLTELHALIEPWREHLRAGSLDAQGEVKLHGDFLQRIFGDLLGYRPFAHATADGWNLTSEQRVLGPGSADGALGFFHATQPAKVIVPIELKGSKQSLDVAVGNPLTPVEQGWSYANKTLGARWIIVSNYRETRLYSKALTPLHYEVVDLTTLGNLEHFKRFFFLLSRGTLLPTPPDGRSTLDELLASSAQMDVEVTNKLYRQYRDLRGALFKDLATRHPNIPARDRLRYTQTILDRTLFVAFAEDRGLLPPKTLDSAIRFRNKYDPKPIWNNLRRVFHWVDKGNADEKFAAYDGGLFATEPELDALEPTDAICRALGDLSSYDFRDDVSVVVLGHIFEQSISDLEELRAEAGGEISPKVSKRKTEGVFYTPAYITRFIVEETLGRFLKEKLAAAKALYDPEAAKLGPAQRTSRWVAMWETYREALLDVRVLDPACGSGAFLLAAYDVLERQYKLAKSELAALGQPALSENDYSVSTILNNNLFGVDLNPESVEITRLSLWLRTASGGRRLTYLDRNIKRGNSVVSNVKLDPWAFDWEHGTEKLHALGDPEDAEDESVDARWREGFDVVIGNPPYVRQERLAPFKEHLEKAFRSYHGVADLYVYFYELGLRVLRDGGRLGFISSGTFARANFAKPFRALLPTMGGIETLVDFGENQPFAGAEMVRPSIVVLRKGSTSAPFRYLLLDEKIPESLAAAMEAKGVVCSARVLEQTEWSFHSDAVGALKDKLSRAGTPLGGVVEGKLFRGVLTGLNEAFILVDHQKDALVSADPSCAAIIKKLVVGEDLRPWYQEDEGRWLIFARHGIQIDAFPSVKAHLEQFREALEPKPRNWPAKKLWKGRKAGPYQWFELQDTVDYHADFARPKIFWPDIAKLPRFSWSTDGTFVNNKGYIVPAEDPALLAILQSRTAWFWLSRVCQPLRLRAGLWQYQCFEQFTSRLPIPAMTGNQREALSTLGLATTEYARTRYALHQKMRHRMQSDLLPASRTLNEKLTSWWRLDVASLRAELLKTFKTDIALKDRDDWESLLNQRRSEHDALTAKIVACEEEINDRVYGLFALDAHERGMIEAETKYRYGEV